jgi:hypothetical protein
MNRTNRTSAVMVDLAVLLFVAVGQLVGLSEVVTDLSKRPGQLNFNLVF